MDIPKGKEMGPEKKKVLGFDFVLVCFLFLLVFIFYFFHLLETSLRKNLLSAGK